MGGQRMTLPLVSVVVPIYNVEPYLHACVDSILNQTYQNIEIVLVDDGSPDNCPAICDEYASQYERVTAIHQRNGGLSIARNNGLAVSRGEYVTFVDSDDWIAPTLVERCVKLMISNSADVCSVSFMKVYQDHTEKNACLAFNPECYTSKEALSCYLFNTSMTVCVWGKVWRRSLWSTVKCPVGKLHEDQYTTYRLLDRATNVVFDPEPLYFYRQRFESIGHSSFSKRSYDLLAGVDTQYNYISSKYPDIENQIGVACSFWYMVFVNMMIRSDYWDAGAATKCQAFARRHLKAITRSSYFVRIRKLQLFLFSLNLQLYKHVYRTFILSHGRPESA